LIRFTDLSFSRGGRTLLASVNLLLPPRGRIGIVGANGAGKSSLFACIRGELSIDRGDIEIPGGWVMAHVGQEMPPSDLSAQEYVLQGDGELIALEKELETLATRDDEAAGTRVAEIYVRLENIGGHSARARAAQLLAGLGFAQGEFDKNVGEFSGGWRMRLNLAQALMTRSDLLLLDEPTNHLDMDAVLWLEGWLARYPGMLLVITHDREFLDAVATHIAYFDGQGNTELYSGNYSGFEVQRGERLAVQQASFEKQQRTVKHLESYINRFRAQATKARQAQSRIKALERMERISAAHVDSPFTFSFRKPHGEPRMLLTLENAKLGYGSQAGGRTILPKVNFSILPNSRIGLLGRNGQGKSTLIKTIAGELALQAGERHTGQHLKIGYFAQHQLDMLRPTETAFWHMRECDALEAQHFNRSLTRDQELRDFLGGFDFRGKRLEDPVSVFSGGEKARLALALIVWQRPNLLLLDEPTNHLDIDMRQALTEALLDYEGAMVIVAHDRHLIRATCDDLMWVHDGLAETFEGDLDDYRDAAKIGAKTAKTAPQVLETAAEKADRKQDRRAEADERVRLANLRKPLQKKLDQCERDLASAQKEKDAVTAWLGSETAYAREERDTLASQVKRDGELSERISELETLWLDLSDQMQWIR
jgi:ATP-binding cassette, subfamily F, member 3